MGENGLTINQSRQDELLNQYNLNLQRPPRKRASSKFLTWIEKVINFMGTTIHQDDF